MGVLLGLVTQPVVEYVTLNAFPSNSMQCQGRPCKVAEEPAFRFAPVYKNSFISEIATLPFLNGAFKGSP